MRSRTRRVSANKQKILTSHIDYDQETFKRIYHALTASFNLFNIHYDKMQTFQIGNNVF